MNVLGVILGVAAATHDPRIILVAGLAATFAESVSMGAVAYTSTLADADFYESERNREYRHIQEVPHLEVSEVREIYKNKGFEGELLDRIVETITANEDVWVAVMMAEEHRLQPTSRTHARTRGSRGWHFCDHRLTDPVNPFHVSTGGNKHVGSSSHHRAGAVRSGRL